MAFYETTFIATPAISRSEVEKLVENYATILEQGGGKAVKIEYWGMRSLAYPINKNRKGHYVMFGIDGPADAVKEMERNIRLTEEVLRLLTVRVDSLDAQPSILVQRGSSDAEMLRGESVTQEAA